MGPALPLLALGAGVLFLMTRHKKVKIDAGLDTLQKSQVVTALLNINDPQVLHVTAVGMQQFPIAGSLIEEKAIFLNQGTVTTHDPGHSAETFTAPPGTERGVFYNDHRRPQVFDRYDFS